MQKLYRDSLGRFRSPPHRRIRTTPRPGSFCDRSCSIFFSCKRDKLANLGKPCTAKARLPETKKNRADVAYDIRIMARQEHEVRRCACEGGD